MIAAMCDKLDNEALTSPKQVLSFVKVTLERCCVAASAMAETDNGLNDEFRSETLSMALGILSLVLTSADKVNNDVISSLCRILFCLCPRWLLLY